MAQQRQVETGQRVESDTIPLGKVPSDNQDALPTVTPSGPAEAGPQQESIDDEAALQMEGVYIISVAARILDMHPQTLRKYERLGLIRPGRTLGMLRLYSTDDIRKLRLIRHLSDGMGLNLAGVEFVLAAVQNMLTMQQRLAARLGPEAGEAVSEELDLLFHSLNLPVDH